MTINAGHAALFKRSVRGTAGFARRTNSRRVVAFAASGTVISAHLLMNFCGQFCPPLLPHDRIVEVKGVFSDNIPQA
jgi:hypothetical protein